jgi:hypothetical protein
MLGICRFFITIFNFIVVVSYSLLWYVIVLIMLISGFYLGFYTIL